MKRILAYVHAYVGHGREAGAETTLADLLESLVQDGWQADVLLNRSYPDLKAYRINGVNIIPYTHKTQFNEVANQYHCVITHLECSERSVFVAQAIGIPVVQLVHNTLWQTEGYLAEGCDLAVYNSNWVKTHHTSADGPIVAIPQKNDDPMAMRVSFRTRKTYHWPSVVVHPQIDPKRYKTGGSHDSVTLINLHENKGPKIFWALANLNPDISFLAVLGGYGHQEIPDVIPQNVEIIQNTKDITRDVYARTAVLLMPSTYESFGRVAIEAAASRIPCIANPTPGLQEALGEYGLYATGVHEYQSHLIRLRDDSAYYRNAQMYAKQRSDHWAAQRDMETSYFLDRMNKLVR